MERFDLGRHQLPITTSSADAQRLFNLGLNWCYGFNQEEGAKCFLRALRYDPDCAIAHWGVAYASGPFYNFPWCDMSGEEATHITQLCYRYSRLAGELDADCTGLERALISALHSRFQQSVPVAQAEFDLWDDAYADAMRRVYRQYVDQQDVMALLVEALITRTPWKLWDVRSGEPAAGADTLEALQICERAISLAEQTGREQHPAILHFHIHLTEMSTEPQRSMRSAERLGALCPDAGHLAHMPGHTYVLCGEYDKARRASEKAIRADDLYVDYAGPFNFYTTARCHDLHLMMYTCMLMGQLQPALRAAEKMCATLSRDVLSVKGKPFLAMTMEGYYSMKMHVLVRFGQWQTIIDAPMPECAELYCVSTSMHHYAKGVAFAATRQFDAAVRQQQMFLASLSALPADRRFFNNSARTTLAIAEKMLEGELLYHQGRHALAFDALREAARRDDNLEYSEPWAWMHPPRHALGALLLEQGEYEEAEFVYRTDLGLNDHLQRCAQHPRNVWSLHGLVECLRWRDASDELADWEPTLAKALANADIAITASCMCKGL